ncbi:hypothetical protein EDM34_01990 [Staphylococcus aureus]|nr:hypothetical protein EDM34_01990 [Staphylococcus aureus]
MNENSLVTSFFSILVNLAGGPQQREIGFPISTDNASWGGRRNKFYDNIISVPLPLKWRV